jgi:hypothetical protein
MVVRVHRIHKWIGVGIGLVLVMWLVTGILITGEDEPPGPHAVASLAGAVVPPSVAMAVAQASRPFPGPIISVTLGALRDRPVYEVRWKEVGRIVDTVAGEILEVDEAWAHALAEPERQAARITSVEQIHRRDRGYQFGLLPVRRGGLHTFATLRSVRLPDECIYPLLVTASLVALAGILTGYQLSLPSAWRPGCQ